MTYLSLGFLSLFSLVCGRQSLQYLLCGVLSRYCLHGTSDIISASSI